MIITIIKMLMFITMITLKIIIVIMIMMIMIIKITTCKRMISLYIIASTCLAVFFEPILKTWSLKRSFLIKLTNTNTY